MGLNQGACPMQLLWQLHENHRKNLLGLVHSLPVHTSYILGSHEHSISSVRMPRNSMAGLCTAQSPFEEPLPAYAASALYGDGFPKS